MKRISLTGCMLVWISLLAAGAPAPRALQPTTASPLPRVRHVFVIVLENEPFGVTFGRQSLAPYLSRELTRQGALLPNYYAIGHYSLDNYIAIISGQAPNAATQDDCKVFGNFVRSRPGRSAYGQVSGTGCIYPRDVRTVADQLERAGFTWKGYMEDMGEDPAREKAACGHAPIGATDETNHASDSDQYADKHDPFVYFHSIIDDHARCAAHVVPLGALKTDLRRLQTTPNFSFITPNLCHDGHDAPCRNGKPGGLVSADKFLRRWVPRITASPAFKRDGLLVITFDEGTDATACCGEQPLPGGPRPGRSGPGGGRVGAVLLSPTIAPGTVSREAYNHYSLLRTVEDIFGLPHLGYAAAPRARSFGKDVFTAER